MLATPDAPDVAANTSLSAQHGHAYIPMRTPLALRTRTEMNTSTPNRATGCIAKSRKA